MSRIHTVNMPDIGEGVVEGEVIEWLKLEGALVKQDEPVVVVMTDKATVELPAPYPGKVIKHYYQPGQNAIKDHPLYDLELLEKEPYITTPSKFPSTSKPISMPGLPSTEKNKILAIPAARKLSKEKGIRLAEITGTGPEGHITVEDVRNFSSSVSKEVSGLEEIIPLIGIKGLMAKKMAESKREIPHFSYFEQADATRLVQLRQKVSEEAVQEKIQVTFMPFLIRALSLTIQQFPLINSSFDQEKQCIVLHNAHHIGIAMSTAQGLIVPVLKDVQKMTYVELIKAYEVLKQKARQGKLLPHEMRGSTITISNFGVLGGGALWATPIINYPEVAILAVAKIQKQPVIRSGEVVARDTLNLSWSFDHRLIDGHAAALCSHHYSSLIQNPAGLL